MTSEIVVSIEQNGAGGREGGRERGGGGGGGAALQPLPVYRPDLRL